MYFCQNIDSSLIASLIKKLGGSDITSFSIGFNDAKYDESIYSSKVSKYLGIKNESKIINANDLLNLIPTFEKTLMNLFQIVLVSLLWHYHD